MRKLIASAVVGAALFLSGQASASFHVMKIVQVHAGADSYVQLQMYTDGQNFTGGHKIIVYSAAGTETGSATLTNVTKGISQDTVLVGTAALQSSMGVTPDNALLPALDQAGGKVCFDNIDCFAWGNYTGAMTDVGTPFAALGTGAAKRKLGSGQPGLLDDPDDTNDCAADFLAGTPNPTNNAGESGSPKVIEDAGTTSSSSGGSSSGVTTVPTDGGGKTSSSTSSSGDNSAPPPAEDDSGCNVGGGLGDFAGAPLLGLGVLAVVSRFRARRRSR